MRGFWYTTSRFFLLKMSLSDKDSGQKVKNKRILRYLTLLYVMRSNRKYCDIFSKTYEIARCVNFPKAIATLAFMQR